MATDYDAAFYDLVREGAQRSATAAVPSILLHLKGAVVESVVDVGCGEGWWARAFATFGLSVLGLDGPGGGGALYPKAADCPAWATYATVDLAEPWSFPLNGDFDLAICLEVAEHLDTAASARLVRTLTALAPVIVFSAAIPGQPGHGHINCMWQTEWAGMFKACGYLTSPALRWTLWDNEDIEWWYRQNIFIAWQRGALDAEPEPVTSVVHPRFWEVR